MPAAFSGTIPSAAIKSEVRRILWQCAGLVRTEAGLKRGLAELQACQEVLPNCRRDTAAGQAAWLETSGMVQVGKAIVLACLSRRESRGAHYRSDFPDRDEVSWKRGSVIQKAGDTLIVDPLYFDVDIRNYTVA
jgi:succinate dehydrogenase/fumarate reductase flavoprotein subunit